MKSKIFTIVCALLLTGALTSCKKEVAVETTDNAAIDTAKTNGSKNPTATTAKTDEPENEYLNGTLTLISPTTLHAVFDLKVKSTDFKYADEKMILQVVDYKGIVLCYRSANGDYDGDETAIMHIDVKLENKKKWQKDDTVRVMCMNENSKDHFYSLKKYFEERIAFFRNDPADKDYLYKYNEDWNLRYGMDIRTYREPITDKDLFKPRLAKGDLILKLL